MGTQGRLTLGTGKKVRSRAPQDIRLSPSDTGKGAKNDRRVSGHTCHIGFDDKDRMVDQIHQCAVRGGHIRAFGFIPSGIETKTQSPVNTFAPSTTRDQPRARFFSAMSFSARSLAMAKAPWILSLSLGQSRSTTILLSLIRAVPFWLPMNSTSPCGEANLSL